MKKKRSEWIQTAEMSENKKGTPQIATVSNEITKERKKNKFIPTVYYICTNWIDALCERPYVHTISYEIASSNFWTLGMTTHRLNIWRRKNKKRKVKK